MRGFTMFLVVVGHIIFSYRTPLPHTYCAIFNHFRMPLFFFVSGWVFYKHERSWDKKTTVSFLKKKFFVQIVPTIVFLSVFLMVNHINIISSILNPYKNGYWFTFVLFEYFLIYVIFFFFVIEKFDSFPNDFCIILFSLIIFCLSFSNRFISYSRIVDDFFCIFSIQQWRYFFFFCMGTIIKKYYVSFVSVTDSRYFMSIVISLFLLLCIIDSKLADPHPLFRGLMILALGITGIIIVLTFFRKNQNSFLKEKRTGYVMQYVGRRTLDIYLLHHFIFPRHLEKICSYLSLDKNPLIEFSITGVLAIFVIGICLVLSNMLRLSPFLEQYLFGVTKKVKN